MATHSKDLARLKAHILELIRHQRLEEALTACQQVCDADPADAGNWFMLASLQGQLGRLEPAAGNFSKVIAIQPGHLDARFHHGRVLQLLGQLDEAAVNFREVLAQAPQHSDARLGLAMVLQQQQRTGEALAIYDEALHQQPRFLAAWFNKGVLLQSIGETNAAEDCLRKALEIQSDFAPAWYALGNLLYFSGDVDGAEQAFRQAVRYQPDYFEARANLGKLLQSRLQFSAAGEQFSAALALQPDNADACNELGMSLSTQGHTDAAEQVFRKALEIDPGFHAAASNLLLTLNYTESLAPRQVFAEHVRLGRSFGNRVSPRPVFANRADPARRLRVGYLSADFRDHSVANFFMALPEHHDRDAFDVFCYASVRRPDVVTHRLQELADTWRDIHGRADADVVETIRNDAIDILVDLGGHTAGNRLPVFAARAAPLQVTWLGYPNTSGLQEMDFRLTDALADPPGDIDAYYSETLARLPGCFLCYTPSADIALPQVQDRAGPVTFGSFNSYVKMTAEVFDAWAAILQALPDARMLIKNFSLSDPGVRTECLQRFAALGIAEERLDLRGVLASKSEHLALYSSIDIALDTFPYNGTTTTCEALWMGIPVITLAGDRHAGRVGVSLMTAVGLQQLIAADVDEYCKLATALASDIDQRRQWKSSLRMLMETSSLCNGAEFARKVEQAYHGMWTEWCTASN